jgi:multimeric flavodoxin WrbA
MKKVIVISTSLRLGSNSHAMAEHFAEGARTAGHAVELISLRVKEIKFCVGCLSCQKTGSCVFKDDVPAIMDSVLNADVVCWATPIYYYEMSGQMKTLIDRMNAMYPKDYRFRDIYLLTTAAEDEDSTPKRAEGGLQGWIDCYEKSKLKAQLFCGGVNSAREIEETPNCKRLSNWGKTYSLMLFTL